MLESSAPLAATPFERALNSSDLGTALYSAGRAAEARLMFRQALDLWLSVPATREGMAETAMGLSDSARALGDFATAEKCLRAVLPEPFTAEHKARIQNELADVLREQDRIGEARSLFADTLKLKGISRQRNVEALLGVADLDRREMRLNASIDEWTKAIELAREDGDSITEAIGLRGLGLTRANTGDLAGAEPLLRRSLAIFRRNSAHPFQTAATLSALASLYREQDKYSLAEDMWLQSLDLFRKTAGDSNPHSALAMESLAELYSVQGHFDAARDYASRALDILRQVLGPSAPATAGALSTTGLVKQREMQPEAAAGDYAAALDILRKNSAMSDQIALATMSHYAEVLAVLHRTKEAKQVRTEMKTFRER